MAAISGDWEAALKPEFGKPYYRELYQKIREEYRTTDDPAYRHFLRGKFAEILSGMGKDSEEDLQEDSHVS